VGAVGSLVELTNDKGSEYAADPSQRLSALTISGCNTSTGRSSRGRISQVRWTVGLVANRLLYSPSGLCNADDEKDVDAHQSPVGKAISK
jgi:hypothetical protein